MNPFLLMHPCCYCNSSRVQLLKTKDGTRFVVQCPVCKVEILPQETVCDAVVEWNEGRAKIGGCDDEA